MPDIGYASMPVIPTFKGLQNDLERGSSKALTAAGVSGGDKFGRSASKAAGSRFKGAAKSIVAPLVGAFAAVKVGNFLKDSVAEARESQKVGALTASTIKATGSAAKVTAAQVGDLSTAISNKTGIDDEAIQRGANMVLTFKNIRNTAGKGNKVFDRATQSITDMAAAMAGGSGGDIDLKSASIQIGKALNDPVKGMTALSKVGVTFTDRQKATNKALVEGGVLNALAAKGIKTTATEFNKIQKDNNFTYQQTVDFLTGPMNKAQTAYFNHLQEGGHTVEAQKNILKELNSEFGGAAAAQTTAGEKVKVAFGNIKESVGTALLPAIDDFENAFLNKGVPAIKKFVDFMQDKGVPAIKKFADKAKPFVTDVLTKTRDILKDAQPYAEGFVRAFNKLPDGVKKGVGATAVLGFGASKIPGGKAATGAGVSAAKGILGIFSKKAPLPVYVVNEGFGGAPGKPKGGAVKTAGTILGSAGGTFGGLAAVLGLGAYGASKFGASVEKSAGVSKFGSAKNPMEQQILTPNFKKDAEKIKQAAFYADNARRNLDKLPGSFDKGMNGAQALASQVFGIEKRAHGAKVQTQGLLDLLEAARQRAIKVEQAVSAARQSKVDGQLGRGGVTVIHNGDIKTSDPRAYLKDAQRRSRLRSGGGVNY